MAIPLDRLVGQKMDAYRGNPQGLQQRYQQNQQLLDLLALQKLKTEKDAAKRELALAEKPKGTMLQQLEREHLEGTKRDMVEQVGGVMQQQQAKQQGNLQRAAQGAVPPPQAAAQGATPPPQVANAGIAAAPRTPMRMAQGGVVGFQAGGGISDEEIARLNNMTPAEYAELDQATRDTLRRQTQAPDPLRSGISEGLNAAQRQATIRDALNQAKLNTTSPLADAWKAGKKFLVGGPEPVPRTASGAEQRQIDALTAALKEDGTPAASPPPGPPGGPHGVPMQPGITQGLGSSGPAGAGTVFGVTPPRSGVDVSAEGPKMSPVDQALKMGEDAGQVSLGTGQVSQAVVDATQRTDTPTAALSPGLTKAGDAAKNLADMDLKTQRNTMNKWMREQLGLTKEDKVGEAGMQSDLAKLLYARNQAGDKAANRAYLSGLAGGSFKTASDQRQAVRDKQMEQGIAGVREIQGQKRAFRTIGREANKEAAAAAGKAYEKTADMKKAGVSALSTIGAADQGRLNQNALNIANMKEGNVKRMWETAVHNTTAKLKVAVGNAAADIATAQQTIQVRIEQLKAKGATRASQEKLLADINKNMTTARTKLTEIYQEAKDKINVGAEEGRKQAEALDAEMNKQIHIQLQEMSRHRRAVMASLGQLSVTKK